VVLPDAIVAVVTRGDEVLMIRRGATVPDPGVWAPFSGKIEPRESQEGALVREVQEEVGLRVRPLRKVWEHESQRGTHLLHWWLAAYVDGELTLSPREVAEARWVTESEVARIEPAFTVDREFFERVFPGLSEVQR
jgi:NADH pyrophosphatase NudC (nudix superfamily)